MFHARRSLAWMLGCMLLAAGQTTLAQGLLVDTRTEAHFRLPRPWRPAPEPSHATYKIESLEIDASLQDSVARVQVSQTFVNTSSRQIEASFVFPLPYDGAIDRLTLLVDGKEYAAELLTTEEARRRYEAIVRQNKDPALLEWVGRGMFQTSVFPIPPGAKRTVTLRFTQLCRKSHGLVDLLFPLQPAKYTAEPVGKLRIRVAIAAAAPLKTIYSATHHLVIDRPDAQHAVVTHEQSEALPGEDFRLFVESGKQDVVASLISYKPEKDEEGYFLLLATPPVDAEKADAAPKTVLLVVDRSGSMSGKKISQARGAAEFVLNNLRDGDLFNIVAYDSEIETFRPELQRFNDETRAAAMGFIHGIHAGGSTNIDGALDRALGMLVDSERPSYLIFLTDGLPTAGVTSEAAIVSNSEKANRFGARLFAFGVGYDVNSRLLDRLARANAGQSEYVRPDADIEAAVSKLYRRIGAPVMTDVEFSLDVHGTNEADGPTISRVYPSGTFDLFAGDQVVILGRYRRGGKATIRLAGEIGGAARAFDYPATLAAHGPDASHAFVAKLWATRRVGEIIDEIDLNGKNDELVKELVALAAKHGILTPYTSFLADENSSVRDIDAAMPLAVLEAEALNEAAGDFGFRQREAKGRMQRGIALGGGYGGGSGLEPARLAASDEFRISAGRGVQWYDARADKVRVAAAICTAGTKTFFRRGDHWVDSTVSEDEEKHALQVERFSSQYFEIVRRFGKEVAPCLAIEDPVVIKIAGKTYRW